MNQGACVSLLRDAMRPAGGESSGDSSRRPEASPTRSDRSAIKNALPLGKHRGRCVWERGECSHRCDGGHLHAATVRLRFALHA